VAYALALLSAISYGAADFLGGLAARGAATTTVVFVSQASGLIVLLALLPFLPAAAPQAADLWWGLGAGASGSIGVALLYRALAIGTMAVVAPTTAVCAVIVPVVAGVLLGQPPHGRAAIGILVALVAIVLVSQAKEAQPAVDGRRESDGGSPRREGLSPPADARRGLGLSLLSGVAIGFFLLCLAQTSGDAGLWPLAAARALALLVFAPLALRSGLRRMARRALGIALGGGILDMVANALYLIAVREGPLAGVVTLSSLYPASTILLARVVLHERLRAVQIVGIVAALVAVVLIVG
jgi:drug/metabolite transporter (DMT)-like permease